MIGILFIYNEGKATPKFFMLKLYNKHPKAVAIKLTNNMFEIIKIKSLEFQTFTKLLRFLKAKTAVIKETKIRFKSLFQLLK